ncbi:MAG: hypothetical protein AB7E36_06900 [Salinivirgaceae bacterium]
MGFDFVLSLDGNNKDYIDFCENYNIPLLYSLEREGVGLSKNRVLKQFPDYKYYFFIDDDVELINSKVFRLFIDIHKKLDYHHLSYSVNDDKKNIVNIQVDLLGGYKGGGCFNFYSKKAIERVGGWHTLFAKYKRFGHTEHSYRVFYSGLNPYPYLAVSNISNFLILNDPPHVTNLSFEQNKNELIFEEQAMIDAKQTYFPLTTLSEFYFNGEDMSIPKLHPDLQKGRYALLKGRKKIKAWGNYYFHKFKASGNPFYLIIALFLYPTNNLLKHWVKQVIKV